MRTVGVELHIISSSAGLGLGVWVLGVAFRVRFRGSSVLCPWATFSKFGSGPDPVIVLGLDFDIWKHKP